MTSVPEGGGNILRVHALRTILPFLLLLLSPMLCVAQSDWIWQNPLPQGNEIRDIYCTDTGLLVAVNGGNILRSTDGGLNWEILRNVTQSSLYGLCFMDATRGIAVGYDGILIRTLNGGRSWTRIESGTSGRLCIPINPPPIPIDSVHSFQTYPSTCSNESVRHVVLQRRRRG